MATVFTCPVAALEELSFLVETTQRPHLIKRIRGEYIVAREYSTSNLLTATARLAPSQDFRDSLPEQLQKVIGRVKRKGKR